MLRISVVGASLALLIVLAPARAHADEPTEAERLFREGRVLFDAGSYDEACTRFAQSQRIDPSAGTALNLGDCYEKVGKVSSAFLAYKEAAVAAALRKRADWEKFALERIEAIRASVPTVTVRAPRADGLVVTRDGIVLALVDGEIADHPDPGPHVIEARAPGRAPWLRRIDVDRGTTQVVQIDALAEAPAAASPPPARGADGDSSSGWQRPMGIVLGAVGVAALAFGTAAGLIAINAKDEAAAKCPSYPDRCTQEGTDTNDRAQTWATISTVSIIGGGVMLAGGAFLFFTASPSRGSASLGITKSF
jgi:hypothetical protein